MIPVIGIIGGIGSGKSLIADAMQKLGGHLIAADQLGHDALLQPEIKTKIIERWGETVLDDQGKPDRKKIGAIVFADPIQLRALESFVFPFIEKRISEEIASARARPDVQFVVLDAAILLETAWDQHCDKIVFVDTPRDLRVARLKETRGWDEGELDRREKMQLPVDEKKSRADAIIVNDTGPEKIPAQVQDALERWKAI